MSVYQRDPPSWIHKTGKVGIGSFIFEDFPLTVGDGQIHASTVVGLYTMETHLHTWEDLAQLHYAQVYEHLIVDLYHFYMHGFIAEGDLYPGAPGVLWDEDFYTGAWPSGAGSFGAAVYVLFNQDCSTGHVLGGYSCPKNTVMEIKQARPGLPVVFTVWRDDLGYYHIS